MPDLHITIVSGGKGRSTSLDVAHETELVKSALLYADRVTLASPRVSMLASISGLLRLDDKARGEALRQMLTGIPEGREVARRISELERKKNKSVDELLLLERMRRRLESGGQDLRDTVERMLESAGTQELAVALQAGVLDIDSLGLDESPKADAVTENVAALLATIVTPGASTFPMIDESAGGLLRAMVAEGIVSDAQLGPASEPALSATFMDELVSYPSARMETILEFREELHDPLIRYRSKVIALASSMEATVIDADFAIEAQRLYRQDVEPALLELREFAEQRGLFRLLIDNTIDVGLGKLAGGTVGFGAAATAGLPQLVGAGLGVAAQVVASALQDSRAIAAKQRQNAYFYLYEGGSRLGSS